MAIKRKKRVEVTPDNYDIFKGALNATRPKTHQRTQIIEALNLTPRKARYILNTPDYSGYTALVAVDRAYQRKWEAEQANKSKTEAEAHMQASHPDTYWTAGGNVERVTQTELPVAISDFTINKDADLMNCIDRNTEALNNVYELLKNAKKIRIK